MHLILAASTIAEFLASKGVPEFLASILAAVVHGSLIFALFGLAPFFFIWLERKVAGRIQDRLGPTRVGGKFGWLQSLADGIKLIQKEDLVPKTADSVIFRMSPYLACVASFASYIVLPFSDGWVAVETDAALFILLGLLSIEVVGIVLAGYSSGSKWSLFGGMREAAQMVSYEIPLALSAMIPIIAAGTLNLNDIGRMQSGSLWIFDWLVFNNPFAFIAFIIYFTVATAECKRAPFDLAEAESELVGGFHTEYSGMRWSFFFMAEYASMFLVSMVAAILFLGAWNTGISPLDAGLNSLRAGGGFGSWVANAFGCGVLLSKGALLVFLQIWVRWTLPRLRIDQVMMTCLKYLLPISCFLFLGAVSWPLILVATTEKPYVFAPIKVPASASSASAAPKPPETKGPKKAEPKPPAKAAEADRTPAKREAFRPAHSPRRSARRAAVHSEPAQAEASESATTAPVGPKIVFWFFAAAACIGAVAVAVSQNVVRMAVFLIVSLGSTAGLFFLANADFVGATQVLVYVGGTIVLLIFGVMLTATGPFTRIRTSPGEGVLAGAVGLLFLSLLVGTVLAVDWNRVRLAQAGAATLTEAQYHEFESKAADKKLVEDSYTRDQSVTPPVYRLKPGKVSSDKVAILSQAAGSSGTIGAAALPSEGNTLRPLGLSFIGARPDRDLGAREEGGAPDGKLSPGYLLPFEIVSVHLLVVLIGAAYLARAKRRAK